MVDELIPSVCPFCGAAVVARTHDSSCPFYVHIDFDCGTHWKANVGFNRKCVVPKGIKCKDEQTVTNERPNNDEPNPVKSMESRAVQGEALNRFITVFKQQWQKGKDKYGTDLMTHNGRNAANDAMQEACDLVAYLVQIAMESEDKDKRIAELEKVVQEDAYIGRILRRITEQARNSALVSRSNDYKER
jgi:hypothetical protein